MCNWRGLKFADCCRMKVIDWACTTDILRDPGIAVHKNRRGLPW